MSDQTYSSSSYDSSNLVSDKPGTHKTKEYRKPDEERRCKYKVGMDLTLSPHRHLPLCAMNDGFLLDCNSIIQYV